MCTLRNVCVTYTRKVWTY